VKTVNSSGLQRALSAVRMTADRYARWPSDIGEGRTAGRLPCSRRVWDALFAAEFLTTTRELHGLLATVSSSHCSDIRCDQKRNTREVLRQRSILATVLFFP